MTSRFLSNIAVLLTGVFLLAASLAFAPGTLGWLGLACGCIVLATVLLAFTVSGRGVIQRWLDAVVAIAGAWTIIAARSFDGASLKWLCFAEAVAFVVLASTALIVHETLLELALRRTVMLQDGGRLVRIEQRQPTQIAG